MIVHADIVSAMARLPDPFNIHEKREESLVISRHVRNDTPYVGRVAGSEKLRVGEDYFRALWFNVSEKEDYT